MKPARRAFTLAAVFAAGLSLIFLLPDSYGLRDSAIIKAFPDVLGDWKGHPQETPKRVAEILGAQTFHQQTTFLRQGTDGLYDRLSMFMVVSGDDMNASIHRPERCFPTQGITINETSELSIPLASGGAFHVTRLASEALTSDGRRIPRLSYYWFVGSDQLTNSHYERALIDIKDRVFKGSNQRWGYVMASTEYGVPLEKIRPASESDADAVLQGFLSEIFPLIHRTEQLGFDG